MSDPAPATPFFDVVLAQRACRRFSPEAVDDATIERVLEAATHAPSAENSQPWVFVVVRDRELRERIGALTRRLWVDHARERSRDRLDPALFDDVDHGATAGLATAPVLVVVGAETVRTDPAVLPASVFPAVQNLLLAANALGLGSALTTLPVARGDALARVVELPPTVAPVAVVPLGRPERPLGPPRRRPVAERAHRDRYGRPW